MRWNNVCQCCVSEFPPSFVVWNAQKEFDLLVVQSNKNRCQAAISVFREICQPNLFIVPSLPFQGDQAVDAHAARAPPPTSNTIHIKHDSYTQSFPVLNNLILLPHDLKSDLSNLLNVI